MNEDDNKAVTQTDDKTEGTDTETVKNSGAKAEKTSEKEQKTFTQEEVNAMLTKERKRMPSEDELKAFREYQESQKTAEQKKSEEEKKHQETTTENESLKKENLLFRKGVLSSDDVEFLVFKISKMDGDFEENVDKFLKENPKYLKGQEDAEQDDKEEKKETTGVQTNKGGVNTDTGVDAILKSRHPELYKNND